VLLAARTERPQILVLPTMRTGQRGRIHLHPRDAQLPRKGENFVRQDAHLPHRDPHLLHTAPDQRRSKPGRTAKTQRAQRSQRGILNWGKPFPLSSFASSALFASLRFSPVSASALRARPVALVALRGAFGEDEVARRARLDIL